MGKQSKKRKTEDDIEQNPSLEKPFTDNKQNQNHNSKKVSLGPNTKR